MLVQLYCTAKIILSFLFAKKNLSFSCLQLLMNNSLCIGRPPVRLRTGTVTRTYVYIAFFLNCFILWHGSVRAQDPHLHRYAQ